MIYSCGARLPNQWKIDSKCPWIITNENLNKVLQIRFVKEEASKLSDKNLMVNFVVTVMLLQYAY